MTEHDVVDTALRHYHRAGPQPGPADLAVIRQQVLARTAARRPVRLRRVAVVAAASLVVAGAAATTITVWPDGTPTAGPTTHAPGPTAPGTDAITKADSASATMDLVVQRVANAQPLDLRHGGYLYTAGRAMSVQSAVGPDGGVANYVTEEVTERWSALDEGTSPKLVRTTRGLNAHPLTPADAEKLARYGTDYTKVTTSTYDPADPEQAGDPKLNPGPPPEPGLSNPTPAFLASLPTDPDQLVALLRDSVGEEGPNGDRQVFKAGVALATATDALLSPELRAALYEALATVPGVERIPGQVDLAGRAGVAIAHSYDGKRTEIVIDPATSRAIGFRMVALTALDGIPAGTVIYSATTNQKTVEHLGDK